MSPVSSVESPLLDSDWHINKVIIIIIIIIIINNVSHTQGRVLPYEKNRGCLLYF